MTDNNALLNAILGHGVTRQVTVKRRAFFSFYFADIMRVNNVRNAWKIDHPDSALHRSFYDSSLWESRKLESEESLKKLIRDGVEKTSAVCVLIGSETWSRRWVRYEIARAVIDQRGLLGVHINGLNHHIDLVPHAFGPNPLAFMAVGKVQANALAAPSYYLYEWVDGSWQRYIDHTAPVVLPPYLNDPWPGRVTPLATGTPLYDWISQQGHANLGRWIDQAAQSVGR